MDTQQQSYLDNLDLFYSLKQNYEKKIKAKKAKIKKNSSNLEEYKQAVQSMPKKCIQCGKEGGTIFEITKNYLTATCNAQDSCGLNIKIKKGSYVDYKEYHEMVNEEMEKIKTEIIKNKLNLLFELDNEDIMINEFDNLKTQYKRFSEKEKLILKYKKSLDTTEWAKYMEFYPFYDKKSKSIDKEPEKSEELKDGEIREEVKEKTKNVEIEEINKETLAMIIKDRIEINIRNMKALISEYNENKTNKIKLREAMEIYVEKIMPYLEKLRELEYGEMSIDENQIEQGGFGKQAVFEYKLNLKKYSENNRKLLISEYKVVNSDIDNKVVQKTIRNNISMVSKKRGRNVGPKKKGMTLTFSSTVENHAGMKIHGEMSDGYTIQELQQARENIIQEYPDAVVELINLNEALNDEERKDTEPAAVLVFRDGVNYILRGINKTSIDLFKEHDVLKKDTKYYDRRRSKVLNKNARHNLCFADEAISANYESGQGTVVAFDSIPITKHIRESLPKYFGDKAANKKAEGNYYFDLTKTGIGFHGDGERRDVIGVRSGQDDKSGFPIHYQWFYKNKPIGKRVIIQLTNSDIYVMSEKAVGQDWKHSSIKTLRHAAGAEKYVTYKSKNKDAETKKQNETKTNVQSSIQDFMKKKINGETKVSVNRPDLHNDDVFKFYSKSKDDLPGRGTAAGGERVQDPTEYEELSGIPNWRKVLSNMHINKNQDGEQIPLFELDGFKWASVEAYYHANKFKYMVDKDESYKAFYEGFTFDGDKPYSRNPKMALAVGGRSGKIKGKRVRPANIVMDPNFESIKEQVMMEGQRAKYEQDALSKRVLLATKMAKLVHIEKRRGKPSNEVVFVNTMEIRKSLMSGVEKIDIADEKAEENVSDRQVISQQEVEEGEVEEAIPEKLQQVGDAETDGEFEKIDLGTSRDEIQSGGLQIKLE